MTEASLHERYAPILHFAHGEQFFPMSVEDFLTYAALYRAEEEQPVIARGKVRPADLLGRQPGQETFLRSVTRGPLMGRDVAADWSKDTLELLARWAYSPAIAWSDDIARGLYDWFSPKTAGATRRFWWNKLLPFGQRSDARSELPRFRLPDDTRASALEQYAAFPQGRPPETYYYRTTRQGRFLNLQYWFFYAYNDWAIGFDGFNDHEGDWEGIQLFFDLDGGGRVLEPPAYICYLGHHSRMTEPWDDPDVHKTGTHPHVYVAAGSHASYPAPRAYPIMSLYNLIDQATGDAYVLDHTSWRRRIDLDQASWVHTYRGSWGTRYWLSLSWLRGIVGALSRAVPSSAIMSAVREIQLPGVSAPRSPRYDDEGQERETWSHSVEFAGLGEV
jgi:hypothetical protein